MNNQDEHSHTGVTSAPNAHHGLQGTPGSPGTSDTVSETSETAAASDGPLTHRQIITILVGLMTGMFLAALDQTIVTIAIRTIADDLKELEHQAWATTAYLISATIATPLYGKLGDIYGRKRLFAAAITLFIAGSALCSLATSMGTLAAYRTLQGLGAGGLFSLALAIIGDIAPPRERAKYQSYFLAVFGLSSLLGPVIGGFFAGQDTILGLTGWRWVFLVNVPIGIVALIVVGRTLHLHHIRLDHRIDWIGALLLTTALVPLLLVAEQGRQWGWTSGDSLMCFGIGGVAGVAFLRQEWRMGDEAIFPFGMFRNKTVGVTSTASVLIGIAMFTGLVSLPLYLQIVKAATPTEAGMLLVPMTLGVMVSSISSGQLIARTGKYRIYPVVGAFLLMATLLVLHWGVGYDTPLWQTTIVMFFFGVGLGFNFQPLTLAVQNAVPPQQIGVATSTATFTRQIGGTIGTAASLSILFSLVPEKIREGLARSASTADFQVALADPANAAFAEQFQLAQGGSTAGDSALGGVMQDSSFLTGLDPRLAEPFRLGFAEAMETVFLVGGLVMVVGFLIMLMLPQIELRKESAYSERAAAAASE